MPLPYCYGTMVTLLYPPSGTALQREDYRMITNALYEEIRTDLLRLAKAYRQRYGGDLDELLSDANLAVVIAAGKYDPAKGELKGWLRYYAWMYWKNYTTRAISAPHTAGGDALSLAQEDARRDARAVLQELSEDARVAALAALEPPADVLVNARLLQGETSPVSLRLAVTEYLKDMGWGASRILAAFAELREVFQ